MRHVNARQRYHPGRSPWFGLLAGVAWCLVAPASVAQSYDCDHGVARIGDSAEDVAARCRTPDHVEAWSASPPARSGAIWFYNDGDSRLLRMLRFRDDRLVAVDSDGYGFLVPSQRRCRPDAPQVGWSVYRLLSFCGAPDAREKIGHLLVQPQTRGEDRFRSQGLQHVFRQRWEYDFGPRYLVREFTIDDASISHVRTLGRGTAGNHLSEAAEPQPGSFAGSRRAPQAGRAKGLPRPRFARLRAGASRFRR
jgi:hypothetical protein